MSQKNVEVVRRAVDGWNRGDVDAWMEAAHPEVEWSSGVQRLVEGTQTVWRGRDEVRRFWDEWHALWDLSIQISEFRNIGDTIVALGQMQIRGKASGIDLRPALPHRFHTVVFEREQRMRHRRKARRKQELLAMGAAGFEPATYRV